MGIMKRIKSILRGAINGALNAVTADDALSDHLAHMDDIQTAIEHGAVERAARLIGQWPDDATAWQKQWLEEHRPKP